MQLHVRTQRNNHVLLILISREFYLSFIAAHQLLRFCAVLYHQVHRDAIPIKTRKSITSYLFDKRTFIANTSKISSAPPIIDKIQLSLKLHRYTSETKHIPPPPMCNYWLDNPAIIVLTISCKPKALAPLTSVIMNKLLYQH